MKINKKQPCPCHSEKIYSNCCAPFHKGEKRPNTALELMKSRYSAYALGLADYIIKTTHPLHPEYKRDQDQWRAEIQHFSKETIFENLIILAFEAKENEAVVTFQAILKQRNIPSSFQEKSYFILVNKEWLYRSGKVISI